MTFESLLKTCSLGCFPKVKTSYLIKGATSKIGIVTVIKNNVGSTKGCSVRFEGLSHDTWFWAEISNDKRSKYMNELEVVDLNKSAVPEPAEEEHDIKMINDKFNKDEKIFIYLIMEKLSDWKITALLMTILYLLAQILRFFEINILYNFFSVICIFCFLYILTSTVRKENEMKKIFLFPERNNE